MLQAFGAFIRSSYRLVVLGDSRQLKMQGIPAITVLLSIYKMYDEHHANGNGYFFYHKISLVNNIRHNDCKQNDAIKKAFDRLEYDSGQKLY